MKKRPVGVEVKNIANGAGGLGFDFRPGKQGTVSQPTARHTAATFLRSCVAQALSRGDGPSIFNLFFNEKKSSQHQH